VHWVDKSIEWRHCGVRYVHLPTGEPAADALLNHARQHRWRAQPTAPCTYSILTSTNKDRTRHVPHRERLLQTAPATHETRPNGPGLTCEFDGGRCWVRTNVGLADGFTVSPFLSIGIATDLLFLQFPPREYRVLSVWRP
jgi:hypothetical protein